MVILKNDYDLVCKECGGLLKAVCFCDTGKLYLSCNMCFKKGAEIKLKKEMK